MSIITEHSQYFAVSLCGNDKDRIYVVLYEKDGYVFLADGKRRKVSNPKKKKKKHIKCFEANKLIEYISEETPVTDGRLRRAIKSFVDSNTDLF